MEARNERSVVASAKTVEDAIASGLTMLGARRDQVDIEIIKEGSRGVLGFGAENAQVRLVVKALPKLRPEEPSPAPEPLRHEPPPAEPVTARREPPPAEPITAQREPLAPVPAPSPVREVEAVPAETALAQVGKQVLADLLHLMGIRATVESQVSYELAEEGQEPPIVLNITGDDLGILIGRRGETLRALQYLVRLMVSHRLKHWTNLIVDVESYLVRRQHALEGLALRVAEQVVRSGRSQALEPMPANERRLVHIALRNHPEVTTHSVGEGERRKVTIIPKR